VSKQATPPPPGDKTPGGNPPPPPPGWRHWLLPVGLLAAFMLWLFLPAVHGPSTTSLTYSQFLSDVSSHKVKTVDIAQAGGTSTGTLTDGKNYTVVIPPQAGQVLLDDLKAANVETSASTSSPGFGSQVLSWAILLLPLLLFGWFWMRLSRGAAGQLPGVLGAGRSRAKVFDEERPATTFADVAGYEGAKEEISEVVDFLRTPDRYSKAGAMVPRGLLMVGPPGTGKTLLARAVAGEAQVPFFSVTGSSFVEMFVGVGAARVRDLFAEARKRAPAIIFIDEVDAIGQRRAGSGAVVSNDEREQTLNQLLVEMDGFDTRQAVVVIAATNRPDGLDKALMRPGRFDRRVTVERPDWNGRLAILKIHSRDVPLARDVDLITIARGTPGMVGADLANLINEAALLAARRNLDAVTNACFSEALDKILIGAERPLVLSDEDLNVIAYHEGGHALTGLLTDHVDPVTKVTIVPRGQALGVTMVTPLDDRYNYSREYLEAQLVYALGGRAAEQVAIGRITTGAENDLQRVTSIARQMVTSWGMSERLGTISYSEREDPFAGTALAGKQHDYSEKTAAVIDAEVNRIVKWAYDRAVGLLSEQKATLDRIARELRLHETIDARQLRRILEDTGAINSAPASYR
jgi:cell division protease FtsH